MQACPYLLSTEGHSSLPGTLIMKAFHASNSWLENENIALNYSAICDSVPIWGASLVAAVIVER